MKALFLVVVFSMSTLVSFACSFGGFFHSLHHQNPSSKVTAQSHHHSSEEAHHHDTERHQEHSADHTGKDTDCCSDQIVKIEKVDKSVARTLELPKLNFSTSVITNFSISYRILPATDSREIDDLVRWRILTTIPDTRIVIQSFQI